jgi:hypothetical protein
MTKKSKPQKISPTDLENSFHNFIIEGCNKFTQENNFDGLYIIHGLLDVALCAIMSQKLETHIKLSLIDGLVLRICDFKYKNYQEAINQSHLCINGTPSSSEVIH